MQCLVTEVQGNFVHELAPALLCVITAGGSHTCGHTRANRIRGTPYRLRTVRIFLSRACRSCMIEKNPVFIFCPKKEKMTTKKKVHARNNVLRHTYLEHM